MLKSYVPKEKALRLAWMHHYTGLDYRGCKKLVEEMDQQEKEQHKKENEEQA